MPKENYLPDPTKWINTAPTSSTKKKQQPQRPLVQHQYGLLTPPATVKRGSGTGAAAAESTRTSRATSSEDTPSASATIKGGEVLGRSARTGTSRLVDTSSRTPLGQLRLNHSDGNRQLGSPSKLLTAVSSRLFPWLKPRTLCQLAARWHAAARRLGLERAQTIRSDSYTQQAS